MFLFWTWAEVALHAVHIVFCLGKQRAKLFKSSDLGWCRNFSTQQFGRSFPFHSPQKHPKAVSHLGKPARVLGFLSSCAGGVRASVWTQICFGENVVKRECPCWDRAKAVAEQGWTSPRWILLLEAGPLSLHVISAALWLCDLPPEPGHVAALHSSGSANQKRNVVWEFLIIPAN